MRILRAEGLTLEPQTHDHAEEMFAVLSDPAIYEFENEPPESLEWLRERYRKLETRLSSDGTQQWLNWVIRLSHSGRLVGYVQATVMPGGQALIGYELGSEFWGQGFARRAVSAMLTELAAFYAVKRVFAVYKTANFRSEGLVVRLGFGVGSPTEAKELGVEEDESVQVLQVGR